MESWDSNTNSFTFKKTLHHKLKHHKSILLGTLVIIILVLLYKQTKPNGQVTSHRTVVLVTGAAGLVGSHLSAELLKRGCVVYGLDNLSTGQRHNIDWLEGMGEFYFIQRDVSEEWKSRFTRLDEIYHLASPASPKAYLRDPIGTYRANTLGTENMINLAKKHRSRLLFASSSEIYGDPLTHPQTESYWGNTNPFGPRACYDESKRMGETLCYIAQREYSLQTRIARIFNTYGPRMHPEDGRVISNFIINGINGDPICIYGNGRQTRSFQYISDLVAGLVRLMASNVTSPVNIGNPFEEHDVLKVASIILDLLEERGLPRAGLVYKPGLQDDPVRRRPDISRAERLLGWRPLISFEEGLRRTIDYFRETSR